MIITLNEIMKNDYLLSAFGFSNPKTEKKISNLKSKYPNLLEYLSNMDGYAFPSVDFLDDKNLPVLPLIQINNVNETETIITNNQKFKYLPLSYKNKKKSYLLNNPCVLLSLTGGSDKEKDISIFFDGSFDALLNQRVCAFSIKNTKDTDLLFYFYAFTMSSLFKEQWMGNGGVQKNTGKKEKKNLYLPLVNSNDTIKYISLLMQAIVEKDKEINKKHQQILDCIHNELMNNQKTDSFKYSLPTLNEIMELDRMDSCLYSKYFKQKEFYISNYKNGTSSIEALGFKISRGQNLQISNIGKSVQSKKKIIGYYKLILPKFLSKYGTVNEIEYLGNNNKLKTLEVGDIIFGAEGNEKGRSLAIIENQELSITNIHGITLKQEVHNVDRGIFVKLFLDYLRDKGMIDAYAVGGNGGSLAIKYWDFLKFPNFTTEKIEEIVKLYHNPDLEYEPSKCNLDNFINYDKSFNETAGIYELDKSMKQLKDKLNKAIDDITNDIEVIIDFSV